MRKGQRNPDTNWTQVSRNLHKAWVSDETTSMRYIVIHDIVPTNERLHATRFVGQVAAVTVRGETLMYTG